MKKVMLIVRFTWVQNPRGVSSSFIIFSDIFDPMEQSLLRLSSLVRSLATIPSDPQMFWELITQ